MNQPIMIKLKHGGILNVTHVQRIEPREIGNNVGSQIHAIDGDFIVVDESPEVLETMIREETLRQQRSFALELYRTLNLREVVSLARMR